MTICIATDVIFPQIGGIATFNRHLSSLLASAGHQVIQLVPDYNASVGEPDEVLKKDNITTVLLKGSYQSYKKQWQPFFQTGGFDAPNWIAMGMAMRDWLIKNHNIYSIDIIEASDYGGVGIFLTDDQLPPVVLTGHGSLLQYSRYNFTRDEDNSLVIRKLEDLSYRHAQAVIVHSPLDQKDLENLFQRDIELALIPWINPGLRNKIASTGKFIAVGGLQPIKGIYEMAGALQLLQSSNPEIHVNWMGNDTWFAPGQKKMSVYLAGKYPGIWQQSFIWETGRDPETVLDSIAGASVVIIPTLFETFNYIALESAACKKPFIITDKAGAAYHFKHGISAWIIPANDPEALADAITRLKSDTDLCRWLGENAEETVNYIFKPDKIINERMRIYNQVIAQRKQAGGKPREELAFLQQYQSGARKTRYRFRSILKKIMGRS